MQPNLYKPFLLISFSKLKLENRIPYKVGVSGNHHFRVFIRQSFPISTSRHQTALSQFLALHYYLSFRFHLVMAADKQNHAVVLMGTANQGKSGPPLGVVDIGISGKAYLCRILLPGFPKDTSDLAFEVKLDGRVDVWGTVRRSEIPAEHKMIIEELSPPGKFSISFSLPGPVDPRLVQPELRPDGILELVVFKPKARPTV